MGGHPAPPHPFILQNYVFSAYNIQFLISASTSETLNFIKVRRQKSSFRDNVLGRKLAVKNGFIYELIGLYECSIRCFILLSFLVNIMRNVFQFCMHI